MTLEEAMEIIKALPPQGSRKLQDNEVEAVRLIINSLIGFAKVMGEMANVYERYLEAGT